ncbi:MAG TPA: acetyl ornithine aminotransferase family protein [Candidatus Dormibacteraeota bacterium]|jgi:4-aminobutyrate aminotransferase
MANVLVAFAIGTLDHERGPAWVAVCYVAGAVKPLIQTPLPGPKAAELIARDARAMSPSFTRAYPFVMERGEGCWVTDVDGNRFLDFTAGIAVVTTGHSHPKVVAAIEEQARRFLHMSGTDFYYSSEIELAERLEARILPGTPAKVFFTNSGAEAIEGAMKLARFTTGRPSYIAFIGAFHGRTFGALSLTASKASQRRRFAPLLSSVFHAPFPTASRGVTTDETIARIEELFSTVAPPESVAAVFVEPIQGEGGYLVPPDDFLPRLRELTLKHGILLVADEVQSGMGRTGSFLAIEHWGVEPDIVCLAKGIASGLPLGAFIARAEQMAWPPGSHGSTFGGNPVACAAGLATLDLLEEGLIENAARVGAVLQDGLREIAATHKEVTDVRGLGLMLAIELKTPELAAQLVQSAFERGLLLLTAGSRAVRISPALVLDPEEAATGLEILAAALDA